MPVGTHVMGLSSSVAVLNAMGFFACGMLAVLNFKYINWRENRQDDLRHASLPGAWHLA